MGARPEDVGVSSERLENVVGLTHRYVDEGRMPGVSTLVARRGEVVLRDVYGMADVDEGRKLADDTIFRIYSMTKPIASVAFMQLYEEGKVLLEDPVSKYLPAFTEPRVYAGGPVHDYATKPAEREITVHDLLTHQSGLGAGFDQEHIQGAIYRHHGLGWFNTLDLDEYCAKLAELPLKFSPGEGWNYGASTDVLGRLIEVISGEPLDVALRRRVFEPLGMTDTGFQVPEEKADRFASNYWVDGDGMVSFEAAAESRYLKPPVRFSAAGGLVGTVDDYHRFTRMLLGGGELDGERVIGRKTLEYMTRNHLPGGADLAERGRSVFTETFTRGIGFGLGFAVVVDPSATQGTCSPGEYNWGGAASTTFWVDPAEELTVLFFTQLMPSTHYPIRRELRATVYGALAD